MPHTLTVPFQKLMFEMASRGLVNRLHMAFAPYLNTDTVVGARLPNGDVLEGRVKWEELDGQAYFTLVQSNGAGRVTILHDWTLIPAPTNPSPDMTPTQELLLQAAAMKRANRLNMAFAPYYNAGGELDIWIEKTGTVIRSKIGYAINNDGVYFTFHDPYGTFDSVLLTEEDQPYVDKQSWSLTPVEKADRFHQNLMAKMHMTVEKAIGIDRATALDVEVKEFVDHLFQNAIVIRHLPDAAIRKMFDTWLVGKKGLKPKNLEKNKLIDRLDRLVREEKADGDLALVPDFVDDLEQRGLLDAAGRWAQADLFESFVRFVNLEDDYNAEESAVWSLQVDGESKPKKKRKSKPKKKPAESGSGPGPDEGPGRIFDL